MGRYQGDAATIFFLQFLAGCADIFCMDSETGRELQEIRAQIEQMTKRQQGLCQSVALAVFQIDHHMEKLALAVHQLKDALVD